MKPDYLRAATKAAETLITYNVTSAPVSPIPILKEIPGVIVLSYKAVSDVVSQDRQCVISTFGEHNQDAFTTVNVNNGRKIVTYNQLLSVNLVQRALARELGHIILGHDGSLPEDVRIEEAKCFANHLLCPRPLVYAIKESGLKLTVEVLGNLTGCYDYCLSCMRKIPGVRVDPELNRKIRDQFFPYFKNFFDYQRVAMRTDGSALADFGTYMEGYEE